jgi:hypothetical protein
MVRKGKKGHLPESFHCELIEKLMVIAPENCRKTLLSDGEFDGNSLQALLKKHGRFAARWNYVLRTRKDMLAKEDYNDDFCLKSLGTGRGEYFFFSDILITQQQYGPVNLLVWHNKKYKEALYLLTNLDFPAPSSAIALLPVHVYFPVIALPAVLPTALFEDSFLLNEHWRPSIRIPVNG